MRIDRRKLQLAMARCCVGTKELAALANLPLPTLNGLIAGRSVRPATAGLVAKALSCDVLDLLEDGAD